MRTSGGAAISGRHIHAACAARFMTAALAGLLFHASASAQDDPADATIDEETIEEISVIGVRQSIQSTIQIKRNSTTIADGLSAVDIGDLPALSIGEALETITGASSHRENGGATEISIRGLGPFLSASFFNGREATNGSGDRAVNFSQFPSELMNKLVIYKTQDASMIEGGVAGVIELGTLKPLDYNRQRIQASLKGNYNPDQQNISGSQNGDLGHRGTLSYVDQFEFDNGSRIGVSVGYEFSDISQPEAEVRSSSPSGSSRFACINEPNVLWEGYYASSTDDCEDQVSDAPYDPNGNGDFQEDNMGYQTAIDPATGRPYSDGLAWAFAPSSRGYRQNDTSDERDAFFGAFQFRPNDRWDINLDVQISERVQAELRNDLNFANQKRSTVGITGPSLVVSPTGAVTSWTGQTAIESNSEIYSREEDYVGGGLNVAFDVSDKLTLSADASFSETTRIERQISLRTQSDDQDIFNNDTPAEISNLGDGGYRPIVSWNFGTGIPQYTINDFDVTDHTLFSDEYRVRIDSDVDRTNTITALRTDFELRDFGWQRIPSIEGGLRISELEFLNLGPTRFQTGNLDDSSQEERDTIQAINEACRDSSFPESDFLSAVGDGNLVTNIDSSTGQPTSGTGSSWATFDTWCVTQRILDYQDTPFAYPEQPRASANTVDVTETTLAGYLMANYETEVRGFPVRGNFGVRVVSTEVESIGWRTEYEIVTDAGGFLSLQAVPGAELEQVSVKDDYTEVLPSVNVVVDLRDDLLLRGGVFRGISRADPSDLGYSRSFALNDEDDITDVDDLITNVSGFGNPRTQPLPSWNYDVSLEWYPNEDTILAGGIYYKRFQGGFDQTRTTETFIIDGLPVNADFTVTETSGDKSELYGFEFTGAYRFSNLPGIWSGLGTKISYNYADSDFVFEDSLYGKVVVLNDDGSVFSRTSRIVQPGNVPGFSEHVFSGQAYWEVGDFDFQLIYKYRSEYFQPYTSNGTRLRYIGDVGVWEARAAYQLTDNIGLSVEAINLFDEPKEQFFFVRDDLGEVNSYGPRIFFGVRAKF